MPAVASLASNLTLPNGLQTTSHLSQEMMARDQRPVIPMGQSRHITASIRPGDSFSDEEATAQVPTKPPSPQCLQVWGHWVSQSISFSNTRLPVPSPLGLSLPPLIWPLHLPRFSSFLLEYQSAFPLMPSRQPPNDHVHFSLSHCYGPSQELCPSCQYVCIPLGAWSPLPEFLPLLAIWQVGTVSAVLLRPWRSVHRIQGSVNRGGKEDIFVPTDRYWHFLPLRVWQH